MIQFNLYITTPKNVPISVKGISDLKASQNYSYPHARNLNFPAHLFPIPNDLPDEDMIGSMESSDWL